ALQRINANWIALTPFAYMDSNTSTKIHYRTEKNWWADIPENMVSVIADARKYGFKLMLKPHFWVEGSGWAGTLTYSNEEWNEWEKNYTLFILELAQFAEDNKIEMFCF